MKAARRALLSLLLISLALPAGAQGDYIYAPRPAAPGEGGGANGILVREIQIRKGDTLSRISRRYGGRGSYYPQILLFNDIKNPHLIREGELLRVPVGRSEAGRQPGELSLKKGTPPKKSARSGRAAGKRSGSSAARRQEEAAGRQFERAQAAFRRGEWSTALARYDRFLADHPDSPLAAEASLRKADCYLRLSGQ